MTDAIRQPTGEAGRDASFYAEFATGANFGRALMWAAVFVCLAFVVSIITELVLIDFVHGNPNRPKSNAIEMMLLFPPLFAAISAIGVLIVFGPSQALQAIAAPAISRRFRVRIELAALLVLPLAAALTWYAFDYLTPSNIDFLASSDPDWRPWVHGITVGRYLAALGAQSAVTTFTMLYLRTSTRMRWRKRLLGFFLLAAIAGGTFAGWTMSLTQEKFL